MAISLRVVSLDPMELAAGSAEGRADDGWHA
jgi:hypothetical protein